MALQAAARRRRSVDVLLKATTAELEVLALVLREMRHARAEKNQMQVVIDAWLCGDGANMTFLHSARGFTASIEGEMRSRKSARPGGGQRRD